MSLKEKIKNSLANTRRQLYSMFEALFTTKRNTEELKVPRYVELFPARPKVNEKRRARQIAAVYDYETIETDTVIDLDNTLEETIVEFGESIRRSLDVLDAKKAAKSHLHLASNGSGALVFLKKRAQDKEATDLSF